MTTESHVLIYPIHLFLDNNIFQESAVAMGISHFIKLKDSFIPTFSLSFPFMPDRCKKNEMWLADLVCDLANIETSLVENGEDTSVLSLDQVTDDLVVEIVHLQTQSFTFQK